MLRANAASVVCVCKRLENIHPGIEYIYIERENIHVFYLSIHKCSLKLEMGANLFVMHFFLIIILVLLLIQKGHGLLMTYRYLCSARTKVQICAFVFAYMLKQGFS